MYLTASPFVPSMFDYVSERKVLCSYDIITYMNTIFNLLSFRLDIRLGTLIRSRWKTF